MQALKQNNNESVLVSQNFAYDYKAFNSAYFYRIPTLLRKRVVDYLLKVPMKANNLARVFSLAKIYK